MSHSQRWQGFSVAASTADNTSVPYDRVTERMTDAQEADLASRYLRAALWMGAAQYVVVFALIKMETHLPLVVVVLLGATTVASNLVIERHLWRRNRARMSAMLDPLTGEVPGGRIPFPQRFRYGATAWLTVEVALVAYLAAT